MVHTSLSITVIKILAASLPRDREMIIKGDSGNRVAFFFVWGVDREDSRGARCGYQFSLRQPGLRASPRFGTLIHARRSRTARPLPRQPGLRDSPRFGTLFHARRSRTACPLPRQPGRRASPRFGTLIHAPRLATKIIALKYKCSLDNILHSGLRHE